MRHRTAAQQVWLEGRASAAAEDEAGSFARSTVQHEPVPVAAGLAQLGNRMLGNRMLGNRVYGGAAVLFVSLSVVAIGGVIIHLVGPRIERSSAGTAGPQPRPTRNSC